MVCQTPNLPVVSSNGPWELTITRAGIPEVTVGPFIGLADRFAAQVIELSLLQTDWSPEERLEFARNVAQGLYDPTRFHHEVGDDTTGFSVVLRRL